MTTTATLAYSAYLGGLSAAQAQSIVEAVPLPADILTFYGVRVTSDNTTAADPVVRTIVLALNPASAATAVASLLDQDSGSPIATVTVTSPGAGYVQAPSVSFTGGRPAGITPSILSGSLDQPAAAFAYLKAVSAAVVSAGSGYSAATFVQAMGGLKAGGRPMVLTPTIVGGHITAAVVTDPGSGYTSLPKLVVIDPGVTPGSGGVVSVSLGVDVITVTRGGAGFSSAPTVVLTPFFQAMFPPTGDQAAPFRNLFTVALEQALLTPISAATPVIA